MHVLFMINPRRTCAARVTVVVVFVCHSFCHSVCYARTHFSSHRSRQKQAHIPSGGWRSENMSLKLLRCRARAFFCSYGTGNGGHFNNVHVCTYAHHPNARDYFKL